MSCVFIGLDLLLLEAERCRSVVWRICRERSASLSLSCHHHCM